MKRTMYSSVCVLLILGSVSAQAPAGTTKAAAVQPATMASSGELERVLGDMDKAAVGFRSAQADFVWDQFSKVVNDHDFQKGVIYYRVAANGVQMASDIKDPAKKYVLFTEGKVDVYQPDIEQVTEYSAGKNKGDFESFLVLGFGGRGHDLQKSFDVTYAGDETVEGVQAAKLTLTPKTQKIKNMFSQILLWIDPARGVSVQQQFIEPSGDYRLAKYSNIKLNQKIGDDVFKLKTTGKTKWLRPQS
jgi:outer membrane lipoprotein-sorting protein